MKIKLSILVFVMGLLFIFSGNAFSRMYSTSYSITSSVISSGGTPMGSANFQANSTLGQPSPTAIATSTGYDLYAGFWYTITINGCIWDLDPDGDVDGFDLYQFINPPYDASDIENFGTEFGRTDCFN
jgi:hypothetical protein